MPTFMTDFSFISVPLSANNGLFVLIGQSFIFLPLISTTINVILLPPRPAYLSYIPLRAMYSVCPVFPFGIRGCGWICSFQDALLPISSSCSDAR